MTTRRPVGFKILDNPDELRRLLDEGLSTLEIAKRSGWSEQRVCEQLTAHGIEHRTPGPSKSPGYW
jgi:hypothetical protein